MVCILTTLATYKFFWSKITASCGVLCVTLFDYHLNIKIVTNMIYFLADMCIPKCFDYFILTNSFGLEKIQSLLLYFK